MVRKGFSEVSEAVGGRERLLRPVSGPVRFLCLLICAVVSLSVCACGFDPNELVTSVQYYSEAQPLMNHIDGLDDYESLEYEAVVRTTRISMGPHEPEYRGVIVLSGDAADEIWNKYDWEDVESVSFEFEKIDAGKLNADTWYYSEEFEKDTIKFERVNYIYFNGNTVVFSFQTS